MFTREALSYNLSCDASSSLVYSAKEQIIKNIFRGIDRPKRIRFRILEPYTKY
jgi:hypothetical protein